MTGAIGLQELCAEVTHPTTGETIINFQKIMKIPKFKKVWSEVMCTELGNISQQKERNKNR